MRHKKKNYTGKLLTFPSKKKKERKKEKCHHHKTLPTDYNMSQSYVANMCIVIFPFLACGVYKYKRACCRAVAGTILSMLGWTDISDERALPESFVGVGAPHTHILDTVFACLYMWKRGMHAHFAVNQKFFRFGLGFVLRCVGAFPVNTKSSCNVVKQIVGKFESSDAFVLQLAPSGTRKYTDHWRSGFMHIAQQARVPIVPFFIDCEKKQLGHTAPIVAHGRPIRDVMDDLRLVYRDKRGFKPQNESRVVLKCELGSDSGASRTGTNQTHVPRPNGTEHIEDEVSGRSKIENTTEYNNA